MTGHGMKRSQFDWPTVRAAVNDRMKEIGLSVAEVADRMHVNTKTVQSFLDGQTIPYSRTVRNLNNALDLPYDHLRAIAEKREPWPESISTAPVAQKTNPAPEPFAALLSLVDLAPGAQMVSDYKDYVTLVGNEIAQGMTQKQRIDTGTFLSDIAAAVRWGKAVG